MLNALLGLALEMELGVELERRELAVSARSSGVSRA